MTTSEPERSYGHSTAWKPDAPRLRLFPLVVSWFATGVALMVAAWLLPGVDIRSFWGALLVAVIVSALNAVIPPVLAALRLPLTLVLGFLLVLVADAADPPCHGQLDRRHLHGRQLRLGTPRRARRRRRERRARRGARLGRHVLGPHRTPDRDAARASSPRPRCPGSSTSRSTGSRCPSCGGRCATETRRTWRAGRGIRTGSWSGRPTSRRRRVRARRGSCWGRTRTSRRSAGWRRRRRR